MLRALVSSEESSLLEMPSDWRAFHFSVDAMWPHVSRINLMDLAPDLELLKAVGPPHRHPPAADQAASS